MATDDEVQDLEAPSSSGSGNSQRPRRAGRPGLRLHTGRAMAKVYELWPFLADSDPHAVVELVVARTADHLRSALVHAAPAVAEPPANPASAPGANIPARALEGLEKQIAQLNHEMAAVRREVAQFSALRNNLITRLDDAVARTREALASGMSGAGASIDPLLEARRDRDMGVMKSTLAEILAALQRIEDGVARRGS